MDKEPKQSGKIGCSVFGLLNFLFPFCLLSAKVEALGKGGRIEETQRQRKVQEGRARKFPTLESQSSWSLRPSVGQNCSKIFQRGKGKRNKENEERKGEKYSRRKRSGQDCHSQFMTVWDVLGCSSNISSPSSSSSSFL